MVSRNSIPASNERGFTLVELPAVSKCKRRAFTLVELLVVIAIIGILVALLLPAIQAAREAARRTQCRNQVKQIALGTLLHVDTQGYFPSGGWGRFWTADPNRGFGEKQPGSWIYNILPYIEEQGLRDLGKGLTAGSGGPRGGSAGTGLDAASKTLHQSPIAMFHCPTRRPARPYTASMAGTKYQTWLEALAQTGGGVVKSDYAANTGDAIHWDAVGMTEPADYASADSGTWTDTTCNVISSGRGGSSVSEWCQTGVMYYRSQLKVSQISDGTTNTYLVGEKYLNPAAYEGAATSADPGWDLGENQSMYTGFEWDNHRVAHNPLGQNKETAQPRQDTLLYTNVAAFGSAHAGGLNMAMCDASVQFIGYDIDPDIHRWLANRQDGNVAEYTQ